MAEHKTTEYKELRKINHIKTVCEQTHETRFDDAVNHLLSRGYEVLGEMVMGGSSSSFFIQKMAMYEKITEVEKSKTEVKD